MKHVLSLLMVFLLLDVEARAISGGPNFGTDTSGVTIGTFAGVMTPKGSSSGTTTVTEGGVTSVLDNSNALGVFTVVVPATGLATGTFAYFQAGKTYVGTITGEADPDSLELRALVKAQFNITYQVVITDANGNNATPTLETFPGGFANGSLKAKVKSSTSGATIFESSGTQSVRLDGEADLDIQSASDQTGEPVGTITSLKLSVDGFKQTTDTINGVDLSSLLDATTNSSTSSTSTSTTSG